MQSRNTRPNGEEFMHGTLISLLGRFAVAIFMLLPISCLDVAGQISQPQSNEQTTAQHWDVFDLKFDVDTLPGQPIDAVLSATFKNADGFSIEAPGFYNGGKQYVVRFTPPTPGEWTYVTGSSLPSLDGQQGKLSVAVAREGRKGSLVLDPKNRRNFQYENGESYFPIAFESDWIFALDAENEDDIPVTRKFVDTLASNGFNQIVLNVFAYDVNWKKDELLVTEFEYGSPRVFPFGGTNTQPDHSTLNIEYFQRLDRVIDYLDQKGIAAHLMIYVWNKQVSWPEADSAEDNRYFDYVVRRYQAYPNLIWDISKEALGYGHTDVSYISERIDRLRKQDVYKRMVTVHDYGYCRKFPDKVDFVSVQIWASELYSVMRKIFGDFPDKPILNIEHGGYERGPYDVFTGSYTSPEVCLERAYQCVFAGTYPTHYWQGAAWNVIIPDIEAMKPEDRPRFEYYRHMRMLVKKFDFANLKSGDKKSSSGFSLHNDKDLFVYFVPKENINIGVRLPKNLRGGSMTGTWFDPLTGSFSEPVKQEITQWPSFDKPIDDQFAILIVNILDTDEPAPDLKIEFGNVSRASVFKSDTFSHWGGSVVKGEDGIYHMYYARWPKNLGWAWVTDSEIAHAVSARPLGPYEFKDVALPRRGRENWDGWCTHNPTIHKFGNKYYLYYMGNSGDGEITGVPGKQKLNWGHRNNQRIGVAVAESPDGPWVRSDQPLVDISPEKSALDSLMTSNPSVCQRPDGGFLMVYKGVGQQFPLPNGGPVVHCVATSESPTGPFVKHDKPVFNFEGERFPAEDPYIWYQQGKYRAIVKRIKHENKNRVFSLVHYDSIDGFDWQPATHHEISERKVTWEDGAVEQFDHLERPQVLIEDGVPIALFCAADNLDENRVRHSFNIQIPLKVSANPN